MSGFQSNAVPYLPPDYAPLVYSESAPTSSDIRRIGTIWINTVTDTAYFLVDVTSGTADWAIISDGRVELTSVTDPAENAAVSLENIHNYAGISVTDSVGNDQNLPTASDIKDWWAQLVDSDDQGGNYQKSCFHTHNGSTYVVVAMDDAGLTIYSVSAAGELTAVDTQDDGGDYRDVCSDGTYIYAACSSSGVRAYSFDGSTLTHIASNAAVDSGVAYGVEAVTTGVVAVAEGAAGLRTYIFNGTAFTHKDGYDYGSTYIAISQDTTYFYCASRGGGGGVSAYTIDADGVVTEKDFMANTSYGSSDTAYDISGIVNSVGHIYLANDTDGLRAFRFDGATITTNGNTDAGGNYRGVYAYSDKIFIGAGSLGLRVYFNDGGTLEYMLIEDILAGGYGVLFDGTYVYYSRATNGLSTYSFTEEDDPIPVGTTYTIISKAASTADFDVIGAQTITMSPGEAQKFIYDGTSWVPSSGVDADDIDFNPATSYLSAGDVQAAIDGFAPTAVKTAEANRALVPDGSLDLDGLNEFGLTGDIAMSDTKGIIWAATDSMKRSAANTMTLSGFTTWDFGAVTTLDFDSAVDFTDGGPYGFDGNQNLNGNHVLNSATHLGLAASGPFYRFDKVDDQINCGSGTSLDNCFASGGSVSVLINPASDGEGSSGRILSKRAAAAGWFINIEDEAGGLVRLKFHQECATTDGDWITPVEIPINEWSHIVLTYDTSDPTTAPVIYRNGVSLSVSVENTPVGAALSDSSQSLIVGGDGSGGSTFDGQIAGWGLLNRALTADEVKAAYAAGPDGLETLGFAAIGASQTEMITDSDNTDFADETINEWIVQTTGGGTCVYDAGPAAEKTALITVGVSPGTMTAGALPTSEIITLESGKRYRIKADIYIPSTHNNWTAIFVNLNSVDGTTIDEQRAVLTTEDSWQDIYLDVLIGADTSGYIQIRGNSTTTGDQFYFDNISITQIGIVGNWHDFSAATAYDSSGNDNYAAVTGATLHNVTESIESTFVYHLSCANFNNSTSSETPTLAGGAAHPTTLNEVIYAPFNPPLFLGGRVLVLDQVTVWYNTDANGDDFDFALTRTDRDGSTTADISVANIGNGETGDQSAELLSAPVTLSDFGYFVSCNVNNTDAATDVKIYDVKFEGHYE